MIVVLTLLTSAALAACDKYPTMYDNIDIDAILNNERLYQRYFNCIMDRGNCTPDGKELKKDMPEAILTDCINCSDKQKSNSDKIIRYMIQNRRKDYDEMEKKYDPTGSYRKRHGIEG